MKNLKKFLGIVSAIGIGSTTAVSTTGFSYKEQDTNTLNLNLGKVHLYDVATTTSTKSEEVKNNSLLRLNNRAMYRLFVNSEQIKPLINKFNETRHSYNKLSIDNFSVVYTDSNGKELNYSDLINLKDQTTTLNVEIRTLDNDGNKINFELVVNPENNK